MQRVVAAYMLCFSGFVPKCEAVLRNLTYNLFVPYYYYYYLYLYYLYKIKQNFNYAYYNSHVSVESVTPPTISAIQMLDFVDLFVSP